MGSAGVSAAPHRYEENASLIEHQQ